MPAFTNEPLISSSPGRFFTSLLSPVSRLSFTSHVPDTTSASAGIWSPRPSSMTSSRTNWSSGSSVRAPSRSTVAFELATMDRRSVVRFERISCTMPIAVLHTMTTMNSMFLYEPVTSTNTARITLMALNSVSVFSRTIWRTERVCTPASTFPSPRATRSSTSAALSPRGCTCSSMLRNSSRCAGARRRAIR